MSKKKISMLIITIVFMGVTVSCEKTNQTDETVQNVHKFESYYSKENSKINFCTDIIVPQTANENLYESKATRVSIDQTKIKSVLFGEYKDGSNLQQIDTWSWESTDGKTLYIDKDYLSFSSNSQIYDEFLPKIMNITQQNNLHKIPKVSPNACVSAINLSDCGLEGFDLIEEYLINTESGLRELSCDNQETVAKERKPQLIYWSGYETWQGIPVFSDIFYKGMTEQWIPLQLFISDAGIEWMQLLYNFEFTKTDRKISLKPFDEVANALEREYALLLTENTYDVLKAELFFWVDVIHDKKILEMEPVWIITVREYVDGNKDDYSEYQEIYSAVTAKNVVKDQ